VPMAYIATTLTLALSLPTCFVLRLEPVNQTFYLIRRLVYPPLLCWPARDDSFFRAFWTISSLGSAVLDSPGLSLPLAATVSPLLS